jgi:hypothetical protein
MAHRKALLIGATDYGEGFAPLPAVQQDLALMRDALESCNYEVEIAPTNLATNGSQLDKHVRAFCKGGGPDDVHLIYFSGHGLRTAGMDCIIPGGVSRTDARESPSQRVSTDLSLSVQNSTTGFVLFVIDACRDEQDSPDTKSGSGWGDPALLATEEGRFVRFFGCRQGEVCHVLKGGRNGHDVSVFSKALADQLLLWDGAISLEQLLARTQSRCIELARNGAITLDIQTPRLSYPETSSYTLSMLRAPIFQRIGHGPHAAYAASLPAWESFHPNHLHCIVVVSAFTEGQEKDWGVVDLMRQALVGKPGNKIWQSFRSHWNDVMLLSGQRRQLSPVFDLNAVHIAAREVRRVYASDSVLDETIRLIVEADLAVFDVTGFEPGVMLLLGVRAASRRGVTICSHGGGWQEGEPLSNTPFNLGDLNLNSHTKAARYVGENPVVERFVRRVQEGFFQLSRQPGYLDLPVFDALRRLGSDYDASSTIDIYDEILVLCSYGEDFFPKWEYIREKLKLALSRPGKLPDGKFPEIHRLVDIATPQLVSQHLYERARRLAGCLMDWTDFSPSAFLELGVRLSVSAWGVVQLVEEKSEPGNSNAARLAHQNRDAPELTQVKNMRDRFLPIRYRHDAEEGMAFEKVVERLLEQRKLGEVDSDHNRIHRIVADGVGLVQAASEPVHSELLQAAQALHHAEQSRRGAPQVLFHSSREVKRDTERAALERRLAAWFYLKNRARAHELDKDDPTRTLFEEIGRAAAEGLYGLAGEQDVELAIEIEGAVGQ